MMYYKNPPEYLLIFYTMDNNNLGDFKPTIHSSIPFFTKEEAEKYKANFLNKMGSNDTHILFAIIPARQE